MNIWDSNRDSVGVGFEVSVDILLTVIFKLHTGVFPGGCRPPDPRTGGRAEVLGDPFWVACFVFNLLFDFCWLQASGGSSSLFS